MNQWSLSESESRRPWGSSWRYTLSWKYWSQFEETIISCTISGTQTKCHPRCQSHGAAGSWVSWLGTSPRWEPRPNTKLAADVWFQMSKIRQWSLAAEVSGLRLFTLDNLQRTSCRISITIYSTKNGEEWFGCCSKIWGLSFGTEMCQKIILCSGNEIIILRDVQAKSSLIILS